MHESAHLFGCYLHLLLLVQSTSCCFFFSNWISDFNYILKKSVLDFYIKKIKFNQQKKTKQETFEKPTCIFSVCVWGGGEKAGRRTKPVSDLEENAFLFNKLDLPGFFPRGYCGWRSVDTRINRNSKSQLDNLGSHWNIVDQMRNYGVEEALISAFVLSWIWRYWNVGGTDA